MARRIQRGVLPFLLMVLGPISARADIQNAGVLDDALRRYQAASAGWASTLTSHASWLFWTLVLISMVWTFGLMALRKADLGEFFAEFVRFTVFTGFFWWLLTNGGRFSTSILESLQQIGGETIAGGQGITPSSIVDIGFSIFSKVMKQSSVWSPVDTAAGILISLVILVVLALVGVNMLLLMISGWILSYAGIFFLGFGGSRWTSEMAINYFRTVLSLAGQLLTMELLIGIGKGFVDHYYTAMSTGHVDLHELAVMLVVTVVLLALVNKVPPLVGALAMGGGVQALGNGFGAGAAVSAAAVGAAIKATVSETMAAGAANVAGGAHALMTAFSQANAQAREQGQGGEGGMLGALKQGSASPLESAIGRIGRVAAGTVSHLASGSWDVAKNKASEIKESAMERIQATTGGKIAEAIEQNAVSGMISGPSEAGEGQASAEDDEVAAFRDRKGSA